MASRGMICFVNSHEAIVHSLLSGSLLSISVIILRPAIPTTIGIMGDELKKAEAAVAITAKSTCCHLIFKMAIREYINNSPKTDVICHLYAHNQYHIPLVTPSLGFPQLAKTRINTRVKK